MNGIHETHFTFPGQTGFYRGKVRDVYEIEKKYLVIIATDRISAFDHILPEIIPQKGAMLNQIAAQNLHKTRGIVPNWLISSPHPYVSIGHRCTPFPLEMIMRGYLCGHALRTYQQGGRILCGHTLLDGMQPYEKLPKPLLTPTTKAKQGHDEDISLFEILQQEIVSKETLTKLSNYSHALYEQGVQQAADKGLILADTKYEFGLFGDKIMLIDEVHTPDSSRFFLKDDYTQSMIESREPVQLSKEFARQWLMGKGFSGQDGQTPPPMGKTDIEAIRKQYLRLFEQFTGEPFSWQSPSDVEKEIESVVREEIAAIRAKA